MTAPLSDRPHERLVDLHIQQSTSGLTDAEQEELRQLSSSFDNQEELERLEVAVSAFDLSMTNDVETIPPDLRDSLLISAGTFFGNKPTPSEPKVELPRQKNWLGLSRREAISIGVAAASLLVLLSFFIPSSPNRISTTAMLDQFIASKPADLVDVAWSPVHNPDARGNVVWSDQKQEGYMVFTGMKINVPAVEQYQLWIFDTDTQQATPVDGGVFNISEPGKSVIPIKPHVPVSQAVQFAVTVERPGGVTVSKRERIPVLAAVSINDETN